MPDTRIHLIIRDAGLASRREAEEMILQGRVTLNGAVVTDLAQKADLERDHIKVDGKLLRPLDAPKQYYLFNKPRHVVSTLSDPEGRPCIGDLIKRLKKPLFSVGRLDFDAEGLMILTNDGALAERLSHPSYQIPRVYLVKIKGTPVDQQLRTIRKGFNIGDGERLGEVRLTVVVRQKTTTWVKVTLYEGKKNELKRIFVRIGHPVRKIRRIGFGPFVLGKLPVGEWRAFTDRERERLNALPAEPQRPPAKPHKSPADRARTRKKVDSDRSTGPKRPPRRPGPARS